ncbi:LEPR-XLL domain-containing protein, partial [Zoogloea sp.]|uniref:LEPR-XLL domain-containing protein n=1 Tax=Zoogloea sp. TaxID=49181 RepID=UPI0025E41E61
MDTRRRRALIESFEPRIMYSAGPGPAGLAAAMLTAAELRVDGGEALQGAGAELVFIDARVPELQLLL